MVDLTLSREQRAIQARVRTFVEDQVLPREADALDGDHIRWPVVEELRAQAQRADLWCPHLPPAWGGMGLDTVTLAVVHEELGVSPLGPLALNCMAPDEGNMHALLGAGTPEQQEAYLGPLARGEVRSCFAMTEPDVAGSDPSTLQTMATRDGDGWRLNGRKWFATGAKGASFAIVVAVTDPEAPRHHGTTLFLVDTQASGWNLTRDVPTMGANTPGGHGEIHLEDVRVGPEAVLGEVGKGLIHAQERLGMGRITHAMRWVGQGQRALDMMVQRARTREAFGRKLKDHQAVQGYLAQAGRDLHLARLAVLDAAWRIDQGMDHRYQVSLVKQFVAERLNSILDDAIQVHGALGYSRDLPLERMYRDARAARIYDGPDEVHQWVQARALLNAHSRDGTTRALTGGER
ncbi:MAG: acyl-CoA dehydrogenase family protein [Candidatus Thermoplasmatota archaeon]|nr:acyl-CoA dehydrogenase family protein [Candidatus Thermoplasmatota archaeon]